MKNLSIVGFKDEADLVRAFAKRSKLKPQFVETGRYRAGELNLVGPNKPARKVFVVANVWEKPESLFRILSLAHELRHAGAKLVYLVAPWIAYGRQDRPAKLGDEATGLMLGKLFSAMFDKIVTLDAHSEYFIKSFKGRLVNVSPWGEIDMQEKTDLVVAPDQGATSRASLAADALGVPFIVMEKKRAGKKVSSRLPPGIKVKGAHVLMVDDMADSGGTLKAAAVVLKKAGVKRIAATVSHAFDLLALHAYLTPEVDAVDCYFDHKSGLLAEAALEELISTIRREM